MTRPMPGPPEDWWYCTPPHGEPGLCTSDMDPAEYMPFTHLQHKRLTDAECAAHYWQAEADEMVHNYTWHDSDFRDEEADDAYAHIRATWRRFKDTPHALEES